LTKQVSTLVYCSLMVSLLSCRVGYDSLSLEVDAPGSTGGNGSTPSEAGQASRASSSAGVGGAAVTDVGSGGEGPFAGGGASDSGGTASGGSVARAGSAGSAGSALGAGGASEVVAPGCSASGTSYVLCPTGASHDEAAATCASMGMRLIRVDSADENDWLLAQLSSSWLGATDADVEGEWRWSDGTLFWVGAKDGAPQAGLYNNWNVLSPNSSPPAADCAKITTAGDWVAVLCVSVLPYVCEAY
jgi:hypothetical protein